MSLSKDQISAINHKDGPMMVLAGPGSGKTTVITERVAKLINSGVNPENILVITFTRAAAAQMKARFQRLMRKRVDQVNFGTFHAVFFKIIKYAYSYDSSHILSDEDRFMFIRDAVGRLGLDVQDEKEFVSLVSSEISLVKNSCIDIKNYYSTVCAADDFKKLYEQYEKTLRSENKIDFEDMMLMCRQLLKERRDILEFWQQRYRYVLIDEFQDINLLQYEIIRMLAAPQNNIFIVGDDDQSIYGFRGSKPGIMLGFEKDYPGAARVLLGINYRCGSDIIRHAGNLIGHNRKRFDKKISPADEREGTVRFLGFKDIVTENEFVVKKIIDLVNRGDSFSDCAVLYRTNSQPRALTEKLAEYNVPFLLSDKVPNIYDHWIARNMIAYMELASGNCARALFLEIANRPKRYIPRDLFTKAEVSFKDLYAAAGERLYIENALDKLRYDLDFLSRLDPFASIKYIRRNVGYDEYLREYATYRHMRVDELYAVADELEDAARGFRTVAEWKEYIEKYKAELKERTGAGRSAERSLEQENGVRLMTFHSAKGLEFTNVFIIDADEGFTPHSKAELPDDIEEERRMFYVAMTRASERLYILSAHEHYGKETEPSRFVDEAKGE